jgi:glycosyltransferase involved in cell wall biosynthesis
MLHALTALPKEHDEGGPQLVSCVYDIPSPRDTGRLDSFVFRKAWRRLRQAKVVWASDTHKSKLVKQLANLPSTPLVCHNCPPLSYFAGSIWPRDKWLREKLREEGANIDEGVGCIVIRAGAIGECCGIEETLNALVDLPDNVVFLMMGRPSPTYRAGLLQKIESLRLQRRAFLWDRPSDQDWLRALQGADVGHMIHGPFTPGYMTRLYELNSSLSNYRLFYYMAAGLPILGYDDPRMESLYEDVRCFRNVRLTKLQSDIRKVLSDLAEDSGLRRELGLAGRNAHLTKYNWEMQFEKVLVSLTKPAQSL